MLRRICGDTLRTCFHSIVFLFLASQCSAQLPFVENFETDGDGTRYSVLDPGFVADTGDAGPAIWGLAAFTEDFTAPISVEGGGALGLAQGAPAKRAAILWDVALTEDDVDIDAWSVWLSLMNWATDGKAEGTVGFFPAHDPDTLLPTLVGSLGYSIVDIEDSTNLPDPGTLDLVIQTNAGLPTPPIAFTDYEVPVIAFNSPNHDDVAITGIGATLDFQDPTTLTVTDASHPIMSSPDFPVPNESIRWSSVPTTLEGLGKAHGGGTVLATIEDPVSGETQPAVFVIEKGDGLLGTFDPNPEGDFYFAGAALNKFGNGAERQLEINPVDVSGEENVKVSVGLAATDADFETGDYLRVLIDTTGTGEFEVVADYTGVTAPANVKGALVDSITGHILTSNEFQDRVFDVPAGAESVTLRFDALNTWGNEIVGIDNIRIFSDVGGGGCDFDGNGVCDVVDLDELLYTGLSSGDLKYDLDGSGSVDLDDRDAFLTSEFNTVAGDFDLDGQVIATDLNILGGNWQADGLTSYAQGDANGDGVANATDLNAVGGNWQFGAAAAAPAAVPEPSGCDLLLGSLFGLLALRRK